MASRCVLRVNIYKKLLFVYASMSLMSFTTPVTWAQAANQTQSETEFVFNVTGVDQINDGVLRVTWYFSSFTPNQMVVSDFVVSYIVVSNDTTHTDIHINEHSRTPSDPELTFKSTKLAADVRSVDLHLVGSCCDYRICVTADQNTSSWRQTTTTTTPTVKACADWLKENSGKFSGDSEEKKSFDAKKIMAGVVAGAVFLVPCTLLLLFIMRKDKKMRRAKEIREMEEQLLNKGFEFDGNGAVEKGGKIKKTNDTNSSAMTNDINDDMMKKKGNENKTVFNPVVGEGRFETNFPKVTGGSMKGQKEDLVPSECALGSGWQTLAVPGVTRVKTTSGATVFIHKEGERTGLEPSSHSVRL